MKILNIIKGFVTNSSSGNYWLDSSGELGLASRRNQTAVQSEKLGILTIQTIFRVLLTGCAFFDISDDFYFKKGQKRAFNFYKSF